MIGLGFSLTLPAPQRGDTITPAPHPSATHLPTLSIAPSAAWSPYRLLATHSGPVSQVIRLSDSAPFDVPVRADGTPDMAAVAAFHGAGAPGYGKAFGQVGSEGDLVAFGGYPYLRPDYAIRGRYPVGMAPSSAMKNDVVAGRNKATTVVNVVSRYSGAAGGNAVEIALNNADWTAAGAIALETTGYQQLLLVGGPVRYKGTNSFGRSQPVLSGIRASATNTEVLIDERIVSLGYTDAAATWTGLTIGRMPSNPSDLVGQDWFATIVYPGALTDADLGALQAWAATAFGVLRAADAGGQFIIPGNSIDVGFGGDLGRGWPRLLDEQLTTRLLMRNMGIFNLSGANIYAQMWRWTAAYDASLPHNLLLAAGVTNDLGAGTTGATAWNSIVKPMIQDGIAAGFTMLVPTPIRRTDWTSAREAERQDFIARVRGEAPALGATVLDFASLDPGIPVPDGVHPSAAGYQMMADYAAPVVAGLV